MGSVLITGITGFIGSHIAANLVLNNYKVIGLKRKGADLWRCRSFQNKIDWVDIDSEGDYKEKICEFSFDTIIHCAWIGVESSERNNWSVQAKNFSFLTEILQISKLVTVKKIVILGSQAEYGIVNGCISENHECQVYNAYGSVKLSCLSLFKHYCQINKIEWIWLRVFSLFGEKEDENWLIPSLIKAIKTSEQMDLTLGEQKYSYLYIKDFAQILFKILLSPIESGIYNVSSNNAKSIKSIITTIKDKINPNFKLNFGALDYRENQPMHVEGDIRKLICQIGEIEFTDFDIALNDTIESLNNYQ